MRKKVRARFEVAWYKCKTPLSRASICRRSAKNFCRLCCYLYIGTYAADFAAIYIPNLTEPDLTPTEVRSPLPAAFGRIEPTAIAFIFARHYLRPSAALTLQR